MAVSSLGLASGCEPPAEETPAPKPARPNVLLIVLDTVRPDHLSTYGYERETSPNLTALAEGGAKFEHVVSTAPWTLPAHASLFTGLSPAEHGAHHEHRFLRKSVTTLAERFSSAGYRTVAFSANPFVSSSTGLDRGFATFELLKTDGRQIANRALAFFERTSEPWFLFLNLLDAHLPFFKATPRRFAERFLEGNLEEASKLPRHIQQRTFAYACGNGQPTPEQLETLTDLYDGRIAYLDHLIGELVAGLGTAADRTIITVISDHGELLGEHGRVEHQLGVWEPLLRVPLIIRYPPRIRPGTVVTRALSTAEVYGMLLRLSELEAPRSAADEIMAHADPLGLELTGTRDIVAEHYRPWMLRNRVLEQAPNCDMAQIDRRIMSVQRGSHKLIWRSDGSRSLFDLATDPGELDDLIDRQPALASELQETLNARLELAKRRAKAPREARPLEPETRDQLRALGYVE